ncbi:MAG TPA: FAD-dependent thymidylate synthase [Thermoplasmata archaeon]|nr:FAD-dependent thymidylate synthase [Thermoplasmata archaeon]
MQWVEPKIYKFGESHIDPDEAARFLDSIGAHDWLAKQPWYGAKSRDEIHSAEAITEIAGRSCYKSFGIGLNPNITRVREDSKDYIGNVLAKGDGSIFEHAVTHWIFQDVSRVFTHELVRHRAGVAISQESLRYVRPTELRMTMVPGSELSRMKNLKDLSRAVEANYAMYQKIADDTITGDMKFDEKKAWTSALRRMLPDGIATTIVWSANHRTLRWVLEMRTAPGAEVEMRYVFDKVGEILVRDYAVIYQDFVKEPHADGVGHQWIPKIRSKV